MVRKSEALKRNEITFYIPSIEACNFDLHSAFLLCYLIHHQYKFGLGNPIIKIKEEVAFECRMAIYMYEKKIHFLHEQNFVAWECQRGEGKDCRTIFTHYFLNNDEIFSKLRLNVLNKIGDICI
jgi:hypothetical protein